MALNRLKITHGASYHPEKACLEGTRVDILSKIRTWYRNDTWDRTNRIALVTGQAGTGKSAILHSIAHECRAAGRLGGFYAFSGDRGPENLFRTIARSLADVDPNYKSLLAKSVDTETAATQSIFIQFDELFCNPLRPLTFSGSVLIIIDALDECISKRQQVIQCLTERAHDLPQNICFLISSRPAEAAALRRHSTVEVFDLEAESQATTTKDIALFVEHRLSSGNALTGFNLDDFRSLAISSEGLFQYAAVVCEEVISADSNMNESPKGAFNRLIKARNGLDGLYKVILRHAYHLDDQPSRAEERLRNFRRVIGWILSAKRQLTQKAWVDFGSVSRSLFESDDASEPVEPGFDAVSNVLRPLGALFSGTHIDADIEVYPSHSSFGEYLLDPTRSGSFFIGLTDPELNHQAYFASACLAIMDRDLRFNMARLESSYVQNSEVPEFEVKARNGVSESLAYSCCYWTEHISHSNMTESAFDSVSLGIISKLIGGVNFLLWIEALALQNSIHCGSSAIAFLGQWIQNQVRYIDPY